MSRIPDLGAIARIPSKDGEPVFQAPWEARAFAMAVTLFEQRHYTWREFQDRLIAEIAAPGASADPEQSSIAGYYEHWLSALEKLLSEKGLVMADVLEAKVSELASAPAPYDEDASLGAMPEPHSD
jgi:nitrile hydratase accessory protein